MNYPAEFPENYTVLSDRGMTVAIIAVLVKRLGGKVRIEQSDFDSVAYTDMAESGDRDGVEFITTEQVGSVQ